MRHLFKLTLFLIIFTSQAFAQQALPTPPSVAPKPPNIAAKSYLLVDYNSGKILAAKDAQMKAEPASLTKMMVVYIIDNEIKEGKLKLTDEILISKHAWQAPGSRMFVQVDTRVKVEDLIKGVIIQSGNDATIALAEHIAGSEQAFADLMNRYAQMLGMQHSHFVNATGLPDKDHLTTAEDMAILARALIKNFPETYKIYAQKEFTYNGIRQTNRNLLLWRNNIVDGIKTGHTDTAGYCLVASGTDGNMRLVSVVMGTKSDSARTEESNKLIQWGFRFFETHPILKSGESLQQAKVWMGKQKKIAVGLEDDLYITTPHGDYKKYTATANVLNFIKAPIYKGQIVGNYVVQDENHEVVLEKPIVALTAVPKGNILQRGRDYVMLNVKSLFERFS
jgi:D-alanyl-D-alanine carboxypeptidase (penicillin-binding protein 5/6)